MNQDNQFLFGESIEELIKRRISVRTYSKKPLSDEIKNKIENYLNRTEGPFDVKIRFKLLNREDVKAEENIKLGTYGMIKGASVFIASSVEKKEHNMEQLGYVFERLILYLTSIGLGTCWMAGTYTKNGFVKAIQAGNDEIVPAVTPIGYSGEKRSLIDYILKPVPDKKIRKIWDEIFFQNNFKSSLKPNNAGEYALPLEMVRLAPSASNKQPWRILSINGSFHFFLSHDNRYRKIFKYDIQKIDMGIAMYHFESTAKEVGLDGTWKITDPCIESIPQDFEYISTWEPRI